MLLLITGILFSQNKKNYTLKIKDQFMRSHKTDDIFFIIVIVLIWFLLCFKAEEIGNDTKTYHYMYEIAQEYIDNGLSWNWMSQPLYYLLFSFLNRLGLSFKLAQLLIYTFSVSAIVCFWRKYSSNNTVALYLWVCMEALWFYMSGLRQMISISLGLFYFDAIKEKKKAKAIIALTAAILIHKTAIILVPYIVFLFWNPPKRTIDRLFIWGFFVSILIPSSFISILSTWLGFDSYTSLIGQSSNIFLILIFVFMGMFIFYTIRKIDTFSPSESLLYILFSSCVLLMCLSGKFYLISREAFYFMAPLCVFFSNVTQKIGFGKSRYFVLLIYTCFFLYYLFSLQSNTLNVAPYHFFWEVGEVWQ